MNLRSKMEKRINLICTQNLINFSYLDRDVVGGIVVVIGCSVVTVDGVVLVGGRTALSSGGVSAGLGI